MSVWIELKLVNNSALVPFLVVTVCIWIALVIKQIERNYIYDSFYLYNL